MLWVLTAETRDERLCENLLGRVCTGPHAEGMTHLGQGVGIPGASVSEPLGLASLPHQRNKHFPQEDWGWTPSPWGGEQGDQEPRHHEPAVTHVRCYQYQHRRYTQEMPGLQHCYLKSTVPHLRIVKFKML